MEANPQEGEVKKTHKKSEKEKRKARKERIENNKKENEPKIEQITETIKELKIETEETEEIEEIEEINEEEEAKKKKQWWPPMTSSPNILNKLLLNLCGIKEFQFYDIFTFDEDYLKTLPKPTLGVFFCLPITEHVKKIHSNLAERFQKK
jgi:flagellar biosynthesis GTPase FlhF